MKTTFKMKKVFERLPRTLLCATFCLLSIAALATPTISDVKVTSVEPLGVAIDYTVSGATLGDSSRPIDLTLAVGDLTYTARNIVGLTNCWNGAHRVYWNMAQDGLNLNVTNASVTVAYKPAPTNGALYCVVDLTGEDVYPVVYLDAPPRDGFTNDIYKTTLLVLKRVEAGTTQTGYYSSCTVNLTRPFYMGIYEVTQRQWELVMDANPCSKTSYGKGEAHPVHYVSYDMIRGSSEGAKWPGTNSVDEISFLGRLRARTGLAFDLPTEAQWEYTCRVGFSSSYAPYTSNDKGVASTYESWYRGNSDNVTHDVGLKNVNSQGLYDLYGNVAEWCLDWYTSSPPSGTDPTGSSTGSSRVYRGGSFNSSACTSYTRNNAAPETSSAYIGFRIARPVQ